MVLNGKKELAYGHADVLRGVQESADALGGEAVFVATWTRNVGIAAHRRYAREY